jgi:hypothetical protein
VADCEETPNLGEMTRDELDAYAAEHGVADPGSFANKADLVAAIEAVPTAPEGETLPPFDATSAAEGDEEAAATAATDEGTA